MSVKEDITCKLFDYSKGPSDLLSAFSCYFKPVLDVSTANRLSGKKLSQTYSPILVCILKQSLQELSKKPSKYQDYLLNIARESLECLSKIYSFSFENLLDYYNLWYVYASKLNELSKFQDCMKVYKKISSEIENSEMFELRVNFYLIASNSLLNIDQQGINTLEQVYDLIAIKCRNILYEHKKIFDGHSLNKVYLLAFKLLMKTGKLLDNLAAGNLTLHEQALIIRTTSLKFLEKTKPLIITDYIAFAYSSVIGSYKFANSLNLRNLFVACVNAIEESTASLEIKEIDKNFRSMLELKSFILYKIEMFSKVKSALSPLLSKSDNLISMLYDIKYYLEIIRAQLMGKLELISDLEDLFSKLSYFFEVKLTLPSTVKTSDLEELKTLAPLVTGQFDNWIRSISSIHSPSSVKSGLSIPASTLKLILEVSKYLAKMVRFQEKLECPVQIDIGLFHYIMVLNYTILYCNTKDSSVLTQIYSHTVQLTTKQSINYYLNLYNLLINLINSGDKEIGLKISIAFIENVKFLHNNLVPFIELVYKYGCDEGNSLKHTRKVLISLFDRLEEQEKTNGLGLKLVEILVMVQCKGFKIAGEMSSLFEHFEGLGKVLEKEIDVLARKIVADGSFDKVFFDRIQENVKVLLFKVYKPFSNEQVNVLITYFEILASVNPALENERLISEIFGMICHAKTGELNEKLLAILKYFIRHAKRPVLILWKCLVYSDMIRENEKNNSSVWISRESLKTHLKIVKNLEKILKIYSEITQISIKKDYSTKKPLKTILIDEADIKTLNLASEISRLYELYHLEHSFLTIMQSSVENLLHKDCLEIRKVLSFHNLGQSKQVFFSLPLETDLNQPIDDFFCNGWKLVLYGEFLFYQGKLEKSQQVLTNLLKAIKDNHLSYKRGQLLKSYSLSILSQLSMVQGNYCGSLSLCKEARSILKTENIYQNCIQNLSVLHTVNDCSIKQVIVYPNTSWYFQLLSKNLTAHYAEIMTRLSMTKSSYILFNHNLKLSKLLASPNLFLYSSSKICTLNRQTFKPLSHENIKEEVPMSIQPVEFSEGIFSNFFEVILEELDQFSKQRMADCLNTGDADLLLKVFDRESLCIGLITLGDILHTPYFYSFIDLQSAEQNYYRLAKYLLNLSIDSSKFLILKSVLQRKLAMLNFKQYPNKFPIDELKQALSQVTCCENFLNKDCCGNKISPLLYEELCFGLLILCTFLLEQNEEIYPYLQYILSLPYLSHPIILNQTHYLLALNTHQSHYQRSFHIFNSIGISYNAQAFLPNFSEPDEMFSALQGLPENYTIIGLSVSRFTNQLGTLITRLEKEREPYAVLSNNRCCTGSGKLNQYLEEFSRIMQEASKTCVENNKVIRSSASQWWETRERLNERLKNLIENTQDQYFSILAYLMVGRISDENIDRMVYLTAKDIFSDYKCECGQNWSFYLLYCLLTSYLTNNISIDALAQLIAQSFYSKHLDEIVKKAKTLKRSVSSKPISQNPVVLIISGHLLHFPWENLNIFQNTYVTRSLSLKFLLSTPHSTPIYKNAYYILNPSNDLDSTQKTFQSFFSAHTTWTGISKEPPSEEVFQSSLVTKDLVIYCGHSSGEQYIRGETIQSTAIKSVTLLFGCSSGLLRSQGFYEPQGVVVKYAIGKCPGLLANLWDVTDKDIDRFSLEMLKKIELGASIGHAIYAARSACKLRYLVGAAPVWYGLPLEFRLM